MSRNKLICVDFDGTCVKHQYPKIGEDVPNAVEVLKKLNENQVKIILWTIRSGEFLQDVSISCNQANELVCIKRLANS